MVMRLKALNNKVSCRRSNKWNCLEPCINLICEIIHHLVDSVFLLYVVGVASGNRLTVGDPITFTHESFEQQPILIDRCAAMSASFSSSSRTFGHRLDLVSTSGKFGFCAPIVPVKVSSICGRSSAGNALIRFSSANSA